MAMATWRGTGRCAGSPTPSVYPRDGATAEMHLGIADHGLYEAEARRRLP